MIKKTLAEMSLQELWQLFPIFLEENKNYWHNWYEEERKNIEVILPVKDFKINHIGSTAVKNIWAKPIIDILVEVPENSSMDDIKNSLANAGYICMCETITDNRMSFNKGYTDDGFAEKVFHLHLRRFGDNDELYFRDYMNDNPKLAKEYEKLKLSLWKKYEYNRDAYTNAKGSFIKKYTKLAKEKYKDRY